MYINWTRVGAVVSNSIPSKALISPRLTACDTPKNQSLVVCQYHPWSCSDPCNAGHRVTNGTAMKCHIVTLSYWTGTLPWCYTRLICKWYFYNIWLIRDQSSASEYNLHASLDTTENFLTMSFNCTVIFLFQPCDIGHVLMTSILHWWPRPLKLILTK